jgi:multiple sugar transport system substrate-binding protein
MERRSKAHSVPRRSQALAPLGGLGSVGQKAATPIADFVLLDMFASYCIGREDAKGAIRIAERQLQLIYR